jgi:hypothetical protein
MCYNVYSEKQSSQKTRKKDKTMRNRKKYWIADFVTDLYFLDDESEMFYAESAEAVVREMREVLGEHLLAVVVRKATWAEKRFYRKNKINPCIVH